MIHHVSIPARDPRHVAEVLAELMGGRCHPFGPLEGAFMAASGDEHGSMIEVYPEQATLEIPERREAGRVRRTRRRRAPGRSICCSRCRWSATRSSAIGAREGWRTKTFGRGMPGQQAVLSRHRVLARKPADDRGRSRRRWPRSMSAS